MAKSAIQTAGSQKDQSIPLVDVDLVPLLQDRALEWNRRISDGTTIQSLRERNSGVVGVTYGGIPRSVQPAISDGTYRHYTSTEAQLNSIMEGGVLVEGNTPMIVFSGNEEARYSEVRGVFMTLDGTIPEAVGCSNARGYVQFTVDPSISLFRLPYKGANGDYIAYVVPGSGTQSPLNLPINVVGSSLDLPAVPNGDFAKLLEFVSTSPFPAGMESLQLYFGGDWSRILRASGLNDVNIHPPPKFIHHGAAHLLRTAFLAARIGAAEGLSSDEVGALWLAGLFHDFERRSDGANGLDSEHGERAAQTARQFLGKNGVNEGVAALAAKAIEEHDRRPDADMPPVVRMLREADALDRFRLPGGCNPAYLTTRSGLDFFGSIQSYYNPRPPSLPSVEGALSAFDRAERDVGRLEKR
ncbi:MAG: HD domain-containing protein [Deltaproteobacteria bacterium]|nr:HD domain-containing protein [Deltaproteobacteria bacterium]